MPETTLQPAAAAGIETYLDEQNPTTNYGTATSMWMGRDQSGGNDYSRVALLKFDLSSIAPGSKIQEVTLDLNHATQHTTATLAMAVHRILPANSGWTEAGATWNTMDGSTAWAGGANGCTVQGTDIEAVAMGTYTHGNAVITPDPIVLEPTVFQRLIDIGNHGILIRYTASNPGTIRRKAVHTSDHGTAGNRPALFVRWLEPSGRLVEYTINIWDPHARIKDSQGNIVDPDEVRPDNWIRAEGFELPEAKEYDNLVEDPEVSYIVGTDYDDENRELTIKTDRNQFAELIIRRLAGGGV